MRYLFVANSEEQTGKLGAAFSSLLEPGMVAGLTGTLGSGKTALVRAVVAATGIDAAEVSSPTFALCVPYYGRLVILHMDAYRIESVSELDELGLDEQVEQGAVLICEWAERVKKGLPPMDIQITATPTGEFSREFAFVGETSRGDRLVGALGGEIAKVVLD